MPLLVTAVNLRGIAHNARLFIVPTAIFVLSILAVISSVSPAADPVGADNLIHVMRPGSVRG